MYTYLYENTDTLIYSCGGLFDSPPLENHASYELLYTLKRNKALIQF